jgi:DNA-binding XRE family transcriptional regulator
MPNIGTLLKSEISRLCRREVRKGIQSIKQASANYRRDIAALKRLVSALERRAAKSAKEAPVPLLPSWASVSAKRQVRFVAKGFKSLRLRLGLTRVQLAQLLGVSSPSIYNWETKKVIPRKEQLPAIFAMRGMSKREVQERLEAVTSQGKIKRRKKAK